MLRRDFMKLAPAGALGAAAIYAAPARSAAHAGTSLVAAQKFRVGAVDVTALGDGYIGLGFDVLQGLTQEEYDAAMRAAFIDAEDYKGAVNAYLIQSGGRTAIVDAGTGNIFGPTLGKLPDALAAVGVAPQDVEMLLATHLHPDHVGGAIGEAGAVFPNAELVVAEADRAFWTNEEIKAGVPDDAKGFFDLAVGVIGAYGDRIKILDGEASVMPGVAAVPLPGHTPGHTGFRIDDGGDSLLIWGDIVHVPPVQFAMPSVTIGFDVDADAARATRMALMDQVATDRLAVAGCHHFFPGVGHLEKSGDGYAFVATPYQYL